MPAYRISGLRNVNTVPWKRAQQVGVRDSSGTSAPIAETAKVQTPGRRVDGRKRLRPGGCTCVKVPHSRLARPVPHARL